VTSAPANPASPDAILRRSWGLFRGNPIIALPLFLIFVLIVATVAVLGVALVSDPLVTRSRPPLIPGWFVFAFLALELVSLIAIFSAITAAYGMADAAWQRGTTTLGDGLLAVQTRAGAMIVALVGFFGVGIAAIILALPTLGLVFLALPLFTMYVFPAVIAGGRGGFTAFRESFMLVRRNFGASAITLLLLFAIQYGISFLALPAIFPIQLSIMMSAPSTSGTLPHFELWQLILAGVGYAIIICLSYLYMSFAAIVQTGLYRELRARAETFVPLPANPI
jgi:hypothetical protein